MRTSIFALCAVLLFGGGCNRPPKTNTPATDSRAGAVQAAPVDAAVAVKEPPPPESPPPESPPTKSTAIAGKQGEPCGDGVACEAGLKCISYYGIAGPSGPKFTSCEIPCGPKTRCPEGQSCTTVSDGPGRVCRAN